MARIRCSVARACMGAALAGVVALLVYCSPIVSYAQGQDDFAQDISDTQLDEGSFQLDQDAASAGNSDAQPDAQPDDLEMLLDEGNVQFDHDVSQLDEGVYHIGISGEEPHDAPPPEGYAYRLLVGLDDGHSIAPADEVISSYGSVHLLGFRNAGDLSQAYDRYEGARFRSYDGKLSAAGASVSAPEIGEVMSLDRDLFVQPQQSSLDALGNLAIQDLAEQEKPLVALVDTGVSEGVERSVCVLGSGQADRTGVHAQEMLATIRGEDRDARVLSIQALDSSGTGTVASVYAGIVCARESGAQIINLSFSARACLGCEAIEAAIDEAVAAGCCVVAAAGNDGDEAVKYCPANVESAITVGACDAAHDAQPTSNWGQAVDTWVEAETTSFAAARVTGRLSRAGVNDLGCDDVSGADGSRAVPLGDVRESVREILFSPSAAHATVTLSFHIYGTSRWSSGTAVGGGGGTSIQNGPFDDISTSYVGNGLSGVVHRTKNTSTGYFTSFAMSLTGTLNSAYRIEYWAHGLNKAAAGGPRAWDGAQASHENAAVDGAGHQLIIRGYSHTVQARYQQADGSWSGYSQVAARTYGYLQTVPAWSRVQDATYQAASVGAYTSSYAGATKYVDVARRSYTASFDPLGGSSCDSVTLLAQAPLGELPVPERRGYEFLGWYTQPEGGSEIAETSTMPLADTTYFAHWKRCAYSVTYHSGEGQGMMWPDELVSLDEPYTVPGCPFTWPGHMFSGWSEAQDGTSELHQPGEQLALDDDIELYAQWEPVALAFTVPNEYDLALEVSGTGSIRFKGQHACLVNDTSRGIVVRGMRVQPSDGFSLVGDPQGQGEFDIMFAPAGGHAVDLAEFAGEEYRALGYPEEWRIDAHDNLELTGIQGNVGSLGEVYPGGWRLGVVGWEFELPQVRIALDSGNGTGQLWEQMANVGDSWSVPQCAFDPPTGTSFVGWNTQPDGTGSWLYPYDAEEASWSGTTLYAQWT